jgi:hypothetical protein
VHFTKLLTAVNAVRAAAGLSALSSAAPAPDATPKPTVKRDHLVTTLRNGLDAARSALSLSAPSYTDPTVTAGQTKVKDEHITELRNGVK